MNQKITYCLLLLLIVCLVSLQAQFKVRSSSSGNDLMVVDSDGNMTVHNNVSANNLNLNGEGSMNALTISGGSPAAGSILRASNSSGEAAWGSLPALTDGAGIADFSYDGMSAKSVSLASSGVSAGTYNYATITVDQYGRITNASNGSVSETDPVWTADKNDYYIKSDLNSGGSINSSSNPVTWTRLKGVPSGFADGIDHVNDGDTDPNAERQRLIYNSSTGQLSIDNGGYSSGNNVTLSMSDNDWTVGSGIVYNNSDNVAIGSTSNYGEKFYVEGSTRIEGSTATGDLHVRGASIKFNGSATFNPQVGLMELTTEYSGGTYGSQKLVFDATSAQYPPDNFKITVDAEGTSRNQYTGFLCRVGGANLAQLAAAEDGTVFISNLTDMNKSGKVNKMVFYDAATLNYDDVFLFNGDGTAEKASGPGDWAGVSDARVKDQISNFTDGLDLLTALSPKQFVYNGNANTAAGQKAIGLIAQDIEKIAPYAVGRMMAKMHPDDATESEILTLDTTPFLYVAINAIKQLNNRVLELEQELAKMQ